MTSFFFQTWLHHITSNSSRSKHNILMYMVDKKWCNIWQKDILLLFIVYYFQGDPLDVVLVHTSKGGRPLKFKKGICWVMETLAMEISPRMDGCFLIGLDLNLFIQSPTLLTLIVSLSSSAGGWNNVIMNYCVQNSGRDFPLSKKLKIPITTMYIDHKPAELVVMVLHDLKPCLKQCWSMCYKNKSWVIGTSNMA